MNGVVYDTAEISKAANKISGYLNYLTSCCSKCVQILEEIRNDPLQDTAICNEISQIESGISQFGSRLAEIEQDYYAAVKNAVSEVEKAETYKYPGI